MENIKYYTIVTLCQINREEKSMKNTRTKKSANTLNLFVTPLTIYLAMVCDKIAARDAQQTINTQALADPEEISLTPESEAVNNTDEQLNEPTLAQHTIDIDYEPELQALFDEIQAEPLAVADDLLATAENSATGAQAPSNEDTYAAHESIDNIPSIAVDGPSDEAMPAGDDGGSYTGLIIGLLVVAAVVTVIVLVANNDDDDDDDDDGSTDLTLTECLSQVALSNECTTLIMDASEELLTDMFLGLGDFVDNSVCNYNSEYQVTSSEIGFVVNTTEEDYDAASAAGEPLEMSFGVYKNTEILETLMNDPETSLTLSFDSLSSECGYTEIQFTVEEELAPFLVSELTSENELVISSNLSEPLNISLDGLCMEGSYLAGELLYTIDLAEDLENTQECTDAQEGFSAMLGSESLSIEFLNEDDHDDSIL